MNIDTKKVELIDWIAQIKDQNALNKLLTLKKKLGAKQKTSNPKIFGSGKHLIEYISDDFNDPIDELHLRKTTWK